MNELSSPTLNEIHDLQRFFTDAHGQLREGQVVNMTGVEERITKVCKAAQQATTEEQQVYLPELTILIDLLNTYEKELRAWQDSLKASQTGTPDNGGNGS